MELDSSTIGSVSVFGKDYKFKVWKLTNSKGPDISGLHSFQGTLMHSAKWDPGSLHLPLPRP